MIAPDLIAAFALTVLLSILLAVAELFSKFRDEPFLVIRNHAARYYILLNALIAAAALYLITRTDYFGPPGQIDWISAGLAAGLGSAVIMRSKFLKMNVRGKESAIGPEALINTFLDTLERQIDRDRSLIRKTLVEKTMKGIDFEKARDYVITTVLGGRQTATPEAISEMLNEMDKINQSPFDDMNKSFALGYLILDFMGERFLEHLFDDDSRRRFALDPPSPDHSEPAESSSDSAGTSLSPQS